MSLSYHPTIPKLEGGEMGGWRNWRAPKLEGGEAGGWRKGEGGEREGWRKGRVAKG